RGCTPRSGRRPRGRPRAPPSPGGFPSTARGVAPFAPTPTTSSSATGAHAVAGLVAAEAAVKYEHGEREPGERGRRHEAGERGPRQEEAAQHEDELRPDPQHGARVDDPESGPAARDPGQAR